MSQRECMCPKRNPDCQHPTCPRWPQPGHLALPLADWERELICDTCRATHDPEIPCR